MSTQPSEAFPWQEKRPMFKLKESDDVLDANGKIVAIVFGYGGEWTELNPPGIRERRRLILEAPAMLEVVRRVAKMPDALGIKEGAQAILDRIEGKNAP